MTNAREEGKNDVDAVFVCFFVSARVVRLFVPLTCRSKVLSLTIAFLLRTSAIQTILTIVFLLVAQHNSSKLDSVFAPASVDCSRFVVGSEPPKKRRFIKRLANLAHLQIYHYLCGGKITALK